MLHAVVSKLHKSCEEEAMLHKFTTSNLKMNLHQAEVLQTGSESQKRCSQHKRFSLYSYSMQLDQFETNL